MGIGGGTVGNVMQSQGRLQLKRDGSVRRTFGHTHGFGGSIVWRLGRAEVELPEVLEEHFVLDVCHLAHCNEGLRVRAFRFGWRVWKVLSMFAVDSEQGRSTAMVFWASRGDENSDMNQEQGQRSRV